MIKGWEPTTVENTSLEYTCEISPVNFNSRSTDLLAFDLSAYEEVGCE